MRAPLQDHLAELRFRLLVTLGGFVAAFVVSVTVAQRLVTWLVWPLQAAAPGTRLAALTLTEGFTTTLRVALYGAVALVLPLALWQAWLFVRPGLLARERRLVGLLLLPMMASFCLGLLLCWRLLLPIAIRFLLEFLGGAFTPVLSFAAYIDFVATLLLGTGLLFELPFVMLFLDRAGLFPVERAAALRRHAIVAIFVVAAVVTPPDPLSQILLATPLLLLFEAGLFLGRFARRMWPVGEAPGPAAEVNPPPPAADRSKDA